MGHRESAFGFEYRFFQPSGVSEKNTRMAIVPNSRPKIRRIEEEILPFFEKNRMPTQFNGDKLRFEGMMFDGKKLLIKGSPEKYATHFLIRTTNLPEDYQALLLSVGGILVTNDRKLVTGIRNNKNTDQCRIYNMVPGGFLDIIIKGEEVVSDSPFSCGENELSEELETADGAPIGYEKMEILGIIYNSRKNYDNSIAMLMPAKVGSSEIKLKGNEHDELVFTDISRKRLENMFYGLNLKPETNSGHLRGDIGLLYARKYGMPSYNSFIERTANKLYDNGFMYK